MQLECKDSAHVPCRHGFLIIILVHYSLLPSSTFWDFVQGKNNAHTTPTSYLAADSVRLSL